MSVSGKWLRCAATAACVLAIASSGCDKAQEAMKQAQDKANELAKSAKESVDKATELNPMDRATDGGAPDTLEGTVSGPSSSPPAPIPEPEKPEVGYQRIIDAISDRKSHEPNDKIVFDALKLPEEWRAKVEKIDLTICSVTDEAYEALIQFPNLKTLILEGVQNLKPSNALSISRCLTLETLNLHSSAIDDAGMNNLKPLTSLKVVTASKGKFGDPGTNVIASWVSLEELDISGNNLITGVKFAKQPCPPKLRIFKASSTQFGMHGCAGLKSPVLEEIELNGSALIDKQCIHLSKIATLRKLDISGNGSVTKQGAGGFGGLVNLVDLELGFTGLRGNDLNFVLKLKALQSLDMQNLHPPEALLAKLRANNPDMKIGL